jgi:hypothetical protein
MAAVWRGVGRLSRRHVHAFPQWLNWALIIHAIRTFLDALGTPGLDEKSRNFQAIQLREALDRAMPGLVRAGIAHQMQATRNLRGADLIESLIADLETILL